MVRLINIVYPQGLGGFFLASLLQLSDSVCSCVSGPKFWRTTDQSKGLDYAVWVQTEKDLMDRSQSVQCGATVKPVLMHDWNHLTHDLKPLKSDHKRTGTNRRSQRQQVRSHLANTIVIKASDKMWQWLKENDGRKPYRYDKKKWYPALYESYQCLHEVSAEAMWHEQGICDIVDNLCRVLSIDSIDHASAIQLAQLWWKTQADLGISAP